MAPRRASECDVATRIQCQAVKPGRERRLAAELAELDAELGQRLLRGVARVLGVAEHVAGEPPDARRVTLAERLQSTGVAVLGSPHEDRVAESLVPEQGLRPKRSADSTT